MKKIFHTLLFTALTFLVSVVSFSQTTKSKSTPVVKKDSIPLKYSFKNKQYGKLFLKNPAKKIVRFDKKLKKFVITEKIGNYYVSTPMFLTPREYDKYRLENDMKDYFREKVDAASGKNSNNKVRRNLLPKYYVNSKFFESIFGGSEIDVVPTGQVNIKLGGIYQNTENPQISVENQSSFTFDFDQQISASLQAKVGKRLKVTANYDTQSTFDFQNIMKLEYTPTEDDILQKLDAGNISFPIKNSLITGAQSLFGVRADFQFGRTTIKTAFSQQNSQAKTVVAEGGSVIEEFELRATDYDNDRHFFLSQFFRKTYDNALKNYPLVSSPINITRIEVWVTNRNQNVTDYRSIVALADIGESNSNDLVDTSLQVVTKPVSANVGGSVVTLPYNGVNNINKLLTASSDIRKISTLEKGVRSVSSGALQGREYSYLQNARKLQANEFTLHPQLGYISLNRRLNDGEVLAVAYEYTVVGASSNETVFKVGEFSNDGVNAPENIAVKLLRSEILTTSRKVRGITEAFPTWNLMMKNIYAIGAYPLIQDGFRFELMYRDDKTGVLLNTLQNAKNDDVRKRTLLNLLKLDRLDQSQFKVPNGRGDGFFDFIEGITVNSQRGYIIFPSTEPFGKDLANVLPNSADQEKYTFENLYQTTKIQAKNEFQNKDKFFLKGYFKSETSRGISLGAFNIPRGSVYVTAGGRTLVEGVDYVVDYQLGRVQILDPGLEASGVPINARVENNTFFNQQRKTFIGVDVEHRFNENFVVGGTLLNVSERPITPKVNYGAEPIDNVMLGFNVDYSTEVPYFTKLANKLPFVETDAPSNLSVRGDFAYLIPGSPSGIDINGAATSYVDDFEASQIPINLSSPQQWFLASTPISKPEFNGNATEDLKYNFKRAKLAWYNVDQLFYSSGSSRPSNIKDTELSRDEVRQVRYSELFPNTDLDLTQLNLVRTLDLAYYPSERGPYNFNTSKNEVNNEGKFLKPEENWGGIMRAITTNNFEQANVEYVQFWLLDPYENYSISEKEGLPAGVNPKDKANQVGKLFINLGNISEDILRDSRKQYENGLTTRGVRDANNIVETTWGEVPKNPSILYAFDADEEARKNQDIGLDGVKNDQELRYLERLIKKNPTLGINKNLLNPNDIAGDNFQFFRGGELDAQKASILTRYKNYNGTEGNSPTVNQSNEAYPTSSTTYPDTEDINKDQTMNTVSAYYEYEISIDKNDLVLGKNNIVDIKNESITLPNGQTRQARWYQFRIPIRNVSESQKIGGITDFNSIRFIRMYLTEFKMPVVLRLGELELVRSDWRRYTKTLDDTNEDLKDELNKFEVGVVNIEQNEDRYVLPEGITRERLQGTNRVQRQNEQSVTLKVTDLKPDKTRAIYKNISIDLRRYKNLKMFLHAESPSGRETPPSQIPKDGDMVAVVRLGTDLNDNFYQVEKPLKISTKLNKPTPKEAWPTANDLDILLEELANLKLKRDGANAKVSEIFSGTDSNGLSIQVKGNPTLAQIRTVMLGVKNKTLDNSKTAENKTVELWFNELRAIGFDNKGGWAAVLSAEANLADVANVSLAGSMSTVGFGSVEQRVQERSIEESKQYNVATNVQLGKMMPKKWNMQVPMNYTYGEEFRDPKYNPQYQDVKQSDALASGSKEVQRNAQNAQDYTRRKGVSFINVKKNRNPESKKKPKFYDVENLSVSYSFNEEYHQDYNIKQYVNQNLMAGASYNFNFKPWSYQPFKKSEKLKSKYWKLIKDININPVPKTFSVNSKITRNYNSQQSRNLIEGFSAQPTLTQRRFMFNWDYTLGFDLTKSLQLNFNATNNYIYDGFGQNEELEIFDKFFNIGRPNQYHQKLNANYKIPINKIPYLGFVRADYGYDADFDWQANSQSKDVRDKVGNMIQNSNTHNLNGNIDFGKFYKTIGLQKLLLGNGKKRSRKNKKGRALKSNKNQVAQRKIKLKKNASFGKKILKGTYDVLTSIKRAKISFSQNNGTMLQGYRPTVGFLGRDNFGGGLAPTFGFVFGSQTDILNRAIENNWLITRNPKDTTDLYYNKAYGKTTADKLDYNVSVKPFKDLTIDFTGNRIKTSQTNTQLDVIRNDDGTYRQNPTIKTFLTGNYSSSHFMLGTTFSDSETLFQNFLDYRKVISSRLGGGDSNPNNTNPGYKLNGQQAMLPAFLAAYSGYNPNSVSTGIFRNVPIPNWRLRYNGLMKYKWFKKNFSSFTLSHGYKSSYTIANFTNNLQLDKGINVAGNFQPATLITQATLIDEFSPLVRVDMKMRNSFSFKGEIRKDRSLTLNFNNNTLTDIKGTEYILGFGYKIRGVKFSTNFTGRKQTLKGDINLRADISLRDNISLIRSIDENNNQVTGGEKLFGLKFLADYNLSRNLTASFYYNHNTFNYAISTTFPRQSINTGINLIYNLGN